MVFRKTPLKNRFFVELPWKDLLTWFHYNRPLGNFRDFIDHPLGNFLQQVVPFSSPSEIKKKFDTLKNKIKFSAVQKLSFYNPLRKFQLGTPQKFRISDLFGKSRQQGCVDIKWIGPTSVWLQASPVPIALRAH